MVINKRGQAIMFNLMIAMLAILAVFTFIQPLKDSLTIARDAPHLDCTNASISTGQSLACLQVDLTLFFFVGTVIFGAIGLVFIKRMAS